MPNTIAENLQRLVDAKNDIADAITTMGGTVNEGDGFEEFPADIATIPVGGDSHFKSNVNVSTEAEAVVIATRVSIQFNVKAESEAPITITDGFTTLTGTGTGDWQVFWLPNVGTWSVTSTVSGDSMSFDIRVTDITIKSIDFTVVGIYGVTWSGGSETTFTRTDKSASFSNPDPYVADGNHPGYSPFDNIWPWRGMKIVERDGNSLVAIPKFWYKLTRNGSAMSFQIANYPADDFKVSPAHQDRDDGIGERDYVYVGRYHCVSDYKSKSGGVPKSNISKATARTGIHNLGSYYWSNDFALFWTIRMLYLVEFADWDSQITIGVGGGTSTATGYTDGMPYHTGTMAANRTTYGANTQYRYIEGLWDNVRDWCEGIYFNSYTLYITTKPSSFSDSGGTNIGTRTTNYGLITSFGTPNVSTFDWALFPSSTSTYASNYNSYVASYLSNSSNYDILTCGGPDGNYRGGMFRMSATGTSATEFPNIGARLMYLPPNNS